MALHMVHVEAESVDGAVRKAKGEFNMTGPEDRKRYRLTRVDHFEDGHIVIDF